MSKDEIAILASWMKVGLVYESHGFLFWDMQVYPIQAVPKPVQYPLCFDMIRYKDDFPLWTPSPFYGTKSPWSKGCPTVNLNYTHKILERLIE